MIYLHDPICNAVQKITVMGYHKNCSPESDQILLQPLRHRVVQMVRRLVQYQNICRCQKGVHKCDSFFLSSGHMRHLFLIICKTKLIQHRFCLRFHRPLICITGDTTHCCLKHCLCLSEYRCLWQITYLYRIPHAELPGIIFLHTRHNFQKCRFSHTIDSDDSDFFILIYPKSHII